MNGTQNLHTDCIIGNTLIERTEAMQKMLEKHDNTIDSIRNRLPNWAVLIIGLLTTVCGWLGALITKG